ncbi:hypothetical protein KAR91_74860 [Candidatus Pacearchaeota archaeon]|nr:hypothetical protein [Candidatus Pacearchaeota archaeon]
MLKEDFDKLTFWIDCDGPLLGELTESQKVVYLERRLERVALIPIGELYASIMENKKVGSALLCFATCICCAITSLGRFCEGDISYDTIAGEDSDECFKTFVSRYMSPEFTESYIDMLCEDFRNGLIYDFAIRSGGFQHQLDYFSTMSIGGVRQLMIDPSRFYKDFIFGVSKYISDLKAADQEALIRLNFKRVFDNLYL